MQPTPGPLTLVPKRGTQWFASESTVALTIRNKWPRRDKSLDLFELMPGVARGSSRRMRQVKLIWNSRHLNSGQMQ